MRSPLLSSRLSLVTDELSKTTKITSASLYSEANRTVTLQRRFANHRKQNRKIQCSTMPASKTSNSRPVIGSFAKKLENILFSKNRCNRPFYRYGGHVELIRFKEYYGMPGGRGYEHYPLYSLSIYPRFSGQFFFTFS